jgi:hypothetical protein
MQRDRGRYRAWRRGWALSILAAGGFGYLVGGWHAATLGGSDPSPAQTVALRFPEDQAVAADAAAADATATADAMVLGDRQFALLSPTPMMPLAQPQPVRLAAAEEGTLPPLPEPASPRHTAAAAIQSAAAAKPPVVPAHRRAEQRPGFMLNDAQIASIKERLHLTPDQERMWPGVEAALRNIAYAKARDAHRRGAPAAGTAELASLSPESAEVQDLKSAAIPLIMSFSDEQKDEVRSLAHVMGLDRLASEF